MSLRTTFKNAVVALIATAASTLTASPSTITLDEFVSLIPSWEVPHGSPNNIVGDGGLAFGVFQIHQVMVDDYNRITGSNASHADVFDPDFSHRLAYAVLSHYKAHIERMGETVTTDHLLYIWNGGGGAWTRVHNPKQDTKQKNLERYTRRANLTLNKYINEKKRRQSPKGA